MLQGPTALTLVNGDAAVAAKALNDAARALNLLEFKGGLLDGSPLSADDVRSIARLPARDVLNAQLVGTIAAPLSGLVRGLNALISGVAIQLQAIADQGLVSGEAPAAPLSPSPRRPPPLNLSPRSLPSPSRRRRLSPSPRRRLSPSPRLRPQTSRRRPSSRLTTQIPNPTTPRPAEPGRGRRTNPDSPGGLDMATTEEWIDELKSISVLELSERIKALEEAFGVSATAVAAAAPAGAPRR